MILSILFPFQATCPLQCSHMDPLLLSFFGSDPSQDTVAVEIRKFHFRKYRFIVRKKSGLLSMVKVLVNGKPAFGSLQRVVRNHTKVAVVLHLYEENIALKDYCKSPEFEPKAGTVCHVVRKHSTTIVLPIHQLVAPCVYVELSEVYLITPYITFFEHD